MENEAPVAQGQVAEAATPEAQGQAAEQPASWYDSAPDEVKGYIQNKGWDDPIKAVTSYQELEKFRGVSEDRLLKLPKDMNEEGALDEIYTRLGRPEKPDGYKVEFEGAEVDSERMKFYANLAHKVGISLKQFEEIAKADLEYWNTAVQAQQKEIAAKQEAEYQALIKEWGSNAAEREELSRRGLRSVLPKDLNADEVVAKIEGAIGTAATLKLFANVGDKISREDRINDSGGDRPFGYTREQAVADKKRLMDEIKSDSARLTNYNKGIGPDIDKLNKLQQIIAS